MIFIIGRDLPDFTPREIENLQHRSAAEVLLRMHRRGERHLPVLPALLKILRAREKTATGALVFPSPAHWKSPQAWPGGKPTDHFLEMCKSVAHRVRLNCGRRVDRQGRTYAAGACCEKFYLHKFRHYSASRTITE
jgi:hypothetical protein